MDIRTLFLAQVVLLFGYTVALGLLGRSQPELKGVRWIAWAYASAMVGSLLGGLRGGWFDPWAVVIADVLLTLPFLLFHCGIAEFAGRNHRHLWLDLPVLLAALLGFAWYMFALPSVLARILVYSLTVAVLSGFCLLTLLRYRPSNMRDSTTAMAVIFGGVTVFCVLRSIATLVHGAPPTMMSRDPLQAGSVVMLMLACVGLAFCFIWMAAERLRGELEQIAQTDFLTGALNRRALRAHAEREIARSHRSRVPLSVMVIDIDHFKQVNDTCGHSAGDEALRAVAAVLGGGLRSYDRLARYGGEEFVVLLPDTAAPDAYSLSERLRSSIEGLEIASDDGRFTVTASFGVAELGPDAESWDALVRRADSALYAAKQAGRNRVVLA